MDEKGEASCSGAEKLMQTIENDLEEVGLLQSHWIYIVVLRNYQNYVWFIALPIIWMTNSNNYVSFSYKNRLVW